MPFLDVKIKDCLIIKLLRILKKNSKLLLQHEYDFKLLSIIKSYFLYLLKFLKSVENLFIKKTL